jgi:hypothetical protein
MRRAAGVIDPHVAVRRWAASGAMALTGRADGPLLGPPERLVDALDAVACGLVPGDPLAILGERAALLGLRRQAPASCGGAARLLPCRDGWVAVSLPRPSDIELVSAWLEIDQVVDATSAVGEVWALVEHEVAGRDGATLRERAALLGLPATVVDGDGGRQPVLAEQHPTDRDARSTAGALVVDLSSLWAGPLCGQLLADRGARVVKVESLARPDGARQGDARFFDLLNGQKASVAVDLADASGIATLGELLDRADVVIEASRPRALDQMGLGAAQHLRSGWAGVWVSITGYGRGGADATRVAFGDDAAAGGGLVVSEGDRPVFCADAIADPLSGMTAARAAIDALAADGTWMIDVSMAAVAAACAGPTVAIEEAVDAAPTRARPVVATAPALGADTADVLAELGIDP